MTFTVQEVASLGRLERAGNSANWGPCPVCDASQTSDNDDRPPLRFKGDDQWLCVCPEHSGEPQSGGPVTLARALHAKGTLPREHLDRILRDYHGEGGAVSRPAPVVEARADGTLDVAGGWDALQAAPSRWRERVERWAIERGVTPELARAIAESGGVAAIPAGRWPDELQGWLTAIRWSPRDLLVAMRGRDGQVVDLERRYIRGQGKPADGKKTARLSREQSGGPEHYLFGDLPRAIAAAKRGEPLVLVEGSSDWALADACCRLRSRGAALGSYGATALPKVAKLIAEAAQDADLVPGSFTVHVIPDIGDWLDQPQHKSHRIGERCAWNAAIELLDVARVRWCEPVLPRPAAIDDEEDTDAAETQPGKADLGDALAGQSDPAAAFWAILFAGLSVLDSGVKIGGKPLDWHPLAKKVVYQRWQRAADWELRRHAYRLPLAEFIHYHHYHSTGDDGDVAYDPTLRQRHNVDGGTRLTRAVEHWLRTHGIVFSRDDESQWVYDPLEMARAPLICHDPPRTIPRFIKVRARQYWAGWLQELGHLNPKSGDGRLIEHALFQHSQRAGRSEVRSWISASGRLSKPVIRMHLGERAERVLRLDQRGTRLVANGNGRVILDRDRSVPVIEYLDGMTPREASGLWWRLAGSVLTVPHAIRSMLIAHTLLVFVRELLTARPILYTTGYAGSGKSMLAKVLTTWITNFPRPRRPTSAAAWDQADLQPLMIIDNLEPRHLDGKMEEFLLTAATGQERAKRSSATDRGVVLQPVKSLIQLNAIGPPKTPEMLRRCLLVEHSQEHRRDGFSEVEHLDAVKADRSALWTAGLVLYQHGIMPALAEGRQRSFLVPREHPNESMREALAVMGVIAQTLSLAGPESWGALDWHAWMSITEATTVDARMHGDPVTLALQELRRQWNRVVIDRVDGQPRRPALSDGLYACRPLYYDLREGAITENPERAAMVNHVAQVVGFEGEYTELYRDLLHAAGPGTKLGDHVVSAKDVSYQIRHVGGWASECVWRHKSGRRRYRWVSEAAVEDLVGDEAQASLADAAWGR